VKSLAVRLSVVMAVLALVLASAGPVMAATNDLRNVAKARTNEKTMDAQVLAWAQAQVSGKSLKAVNLAKARAHHCIGCTSEAVAFQVVLTSDTSTYVLTNNATSVETVCETCTAVSVAEQWVVGATNGTVVLSTAGQSALAALHTELTTLVALPPSDALAGILGAAQAISAILAADVSVVPSAQSPPSPGAPLVSPLVQPRPIIYHYAQVSN
jgi:heme exporter protein D